MIKINDKSMCSGCHSCLNICPVNCISMKIDEEGFWYPYVDSSKCIDCHLCEKRCPILNDMSNQNNPKAYACYNLNEKIRNESSSGGIFSLLASNIIKKNGVVYGASFNQNFEVEHIRVDKIDDLNKLRGSKYVQSKIGNTYSEIKKELDDERIVYFSGTPCQIDGLLCYLDKKYDNLICQDIVCHGVPSPKLWKHYLSQYTLEDDANITFRDKTTGWDSYSFTINQKQKFSEIASQNEYMKVFLKDLCLRPSCYDCHSKSLHRNSDITLADFWGIKEVCPDLYDNKGTSLVLINTEIGQKLFGEILDYIKYKEVDVQQAAKYNPSLYKSASISRKRSRYMKRVFSTNFNTISMKYTKNSFLVRLRYFIKNKFNIS